MGLQDRDYWKERYDENMGIRSKPKYRKDTSNLEKLRFFSEAKRSPTSWHWSLQVILFVWICIGVYAVLLLINSFLLKP